MDSFTDFYTVLGVKPNAPPDAVKSAFKKLALQYHPDVYKGEDAQERMQLLLLAYQTLSDPAARKTYDARRSEHVLDASPYPPLSSRSDSRGRPGATAEVSPMARRDRQRHYDFPELSPLAGTGETGETYTAARVTLGDVMYDLSPDEACILAQQGMLRGVAPEASGKLNPETLQRTLHYCHRCHHRWTPISVGGRRPQLPQHSCPTCKARDWGEYLLLRCVHCRAVFESEQIRYEIGTYNYGDDALCPPYELFPLCPYCGASGWCPAEDARVSILRVQVARRRVIVRVVWLSVVIVVVLVLGVVVWTMVLVR